MGISDLVKCNVYGLNKLINTLLVISIPSGYKYEEDDSTFKSDHCSIACIYLNLQPQEESVPQSLHYTTLAKG